MKNKNILITGGAGSEGTKLIKQLLSEGFDPDSIVVIDNLSSGKYIPEIHDEIIFIEKDITNFIDVLNHLNAVRFKPEIIYHLAKENLDSVAERDPQKIITNNVGGAVSILQLGRKLKVECVNFVVKKDTFKTDFLQLTNNFIDDIRKYFKEKYNVISNVI